MKNLNRVLCTSGRNAIFSSSFKGMGLACLVAMGGSVASAEAIEENTSYEYPYADYEVYDEAVIESEVYTPRMTFTNRRGSQATFYGQFNPVYQVFDDGEETTEGVVDNGNWNSRLGFLVRVPVNDNTLRFRFETGLGLRNSAGVS